MGYYTYFSLTMQGDDEKIDSAVKDAETCGNEMIQELVCSGGIDAKWYGFDDEFRKFAKRHPDVLFMVFGDGEDSEDIWEHRFKGDENERQEFTMPPFIRLLTEAEKKQIH